MIVNNENAFTIMDALADDTEIEVYNSNEKFLGRGRVIKVFKNGFRIHGEIAPIIGAREGTFFWKDMPIVIPAR